MTCTLSPSSSVCDSPHSSPMRSTDSSPSPRRAVWASSSKRFIAVWRNTVAIAPSTLRASSDSRDSAGSASSSSRANMICSPNTEAVSAIVSGVDICRIPCRAASAPCTPWPSSWASVRTSWRLAV